MRNPVCQWIAGLSLAFFMAVVPIVYYRNVYTNSKRLRTVTEGKFYRSGCLTAAGFREAIRKHGIKTVINLQDEAPDPDLYNHYFTLNTTKESEICREAGAKFVYLEVGLVPWMDFPAKQSATLAAYREILDNPENYPILLHCRAGLHRTGCLVAVYRQDYEGWSHEDSLRELKANGFGEFFSTTANPYIVQYVVGHPPRRGKAGGSAKSTNDPFHEASFQPLPPNQGTRPQP